MLKTVHKYLALYPIDPASEALIVGTIHPHWDERFQVPFFYGNVCSIWKILHTAFPMELTDPFQLVSIRNFLQGRKISMSDMIVRCDRKTDSALDKDLVPTELNRALWQQIQNSTIKKIYFTSGFGKNNAFKLFYKDLLGRRITPEIRKNRGITLEPEVFGRPVSLHILYSPSGAANTGLVNSTAYKSVAHCYAHHSTPVQAFKIDYYWKAFVGEEV
jgi:G:T/U-mismatch repair DNA glycosylase